MEAAMAVTYYVALPIVRTEEGVAPGEGKEMPNERAAMSYRRILVTDGVRRQRFELAI